MMRKITLIISVSLLLTFNFSLLTLNAQTFEEIQKLLADDGASEDYFGYSVSIYGDHAIVGAIDDDDNGSSSGSAYIFKNYSGIWQQQAKITASDGATYDGFGSSVCIYGDFAIVGATGDDDNGSKSGSAYVFYNNAGIWQQQAKLTASDAVAYDYFGVSVSILGEYAIVGAYGDDDNGSFSGSAYIFHYNSGIWQQQTKLTAFDGTNSDYFGFSVNISSDYVIVGAYNDDDNGSSSGSAYIFHYNSGVWQYQAKLTAFDGAADDEFGYFLGISGDYAIVGAHGDDDNGNNSGSAYIFINNSGLWQQQAKLTASDPEAYDGFGHKVCIFGEYAIVGANGDDDNGSNSGSAYIFYNNSGTWQEQSKITAYDGTDSDYFGWSVSISDQYAIVGAIHDDDNGTSSGSAYIFGPPQPESDSLNLTVFLEGPYNSTDMNTDLNPDPIPLSQPYNDPLKWNYQGTESVTAIPNADVVDWVLVELRETSGDASTALPDSLISQQAAFILKDGSIVGLDGANPLYFDNEITNNLYVVVYHRNHLPIMSSGPLTAAKGDYTWDFTTAMGQAYGTDAQFDLGGGVFGMIGGDGDADGLVKIHDIDTVWSYEAGNSGYLSGDFSLDKQTDNKDKNAIWNLNDLHISQVPGYICTPQPDYADAGQDQLGNCDWMEIYLNANTPINGTGTWTIESGTWGNIDDIHNPHTAFWGSLGQSYNLKWTISNDCGENYDFVVIAYEQLPGQTDAGPDQLSIPGTSTILQANNVEWAFWEIVSGEGGSFENSSDPHTIFYGTEGNTYELKWQVILACDWSEDFVTISFAPPPWSCGDQISDIDGNSYNTTPLGTQCWMAENLKTTTYNSGTPIPNATDNGAWQNLTTGSYVWYDNNITWKDSYGALYNWFAAVDPNGVCPTGWYLPSHAEWVTLANYVGGDGNQLKSCRQVNSPLAGSCNTSEHPRWNQHSTEYGTDDYGFSGLPSGYRTYNGTFGFIGGIGYWWSSVEELANDAWTYGLEYSFGGLIPGYDSKQAGFPVRCVKSESINLNPFQPSSPSPQNGSINIFIDTVLTWSCSDPDGDDLTYNIYFGTNPNPPLVQVNHIDTFYNPGELLFDNIYYWKIVAYDTPGDSTAGGIWNFSTLEITSWSCGDALIDDRDAQVYNTIQIGSQCWMEENLNIGTRIDGINDQTDDSIIEKYCYNDIEDSCSVFGGFYQWDEVMDYTTVEGSQGICPVGWHVPTDEEWKQLEGEVDSQYGYPDPEWDGTGVRGFDAGVNLRSTYGWEYFGFNHTDPYGFTALASGSRSTNGSFTNCSYDTRYWSSTEIGTLAWERYIVFDFEGVSRFNVNKAYGSSIRCLKNE